MRRLKISWEVALMKISDTAAFLREHDDFLILTHRYPDGDTIGSGYALFHALKAIGKRARVICGDNIPKKYSYITEKAVFEDFEPQCIVAVDVADTKLLGSLEAEYKDKVELCIDHHGSNTRYAKNLFLEETAAAGELVYQLIKELGAEVDKNIAECIYTAVSTDTGCFKYSNTTSQSLRIAAELLDIGIDTATINYLMFDCRSKAKIMLEKLVLESLRFDCDGKCASVFVTSDMIEKSGADDNDLDGMASIPRTIEGVKCGVTFRSSDSGFKISVRTHGDINACSICGELGGGGHPAASGCFVAGDMEYAYSKVIGVVKKYLEE